MKIAHISDLHFDNTYKRANYHNTNRLFEYIADNRFDHVVISGDITENAEPSAFETAKKLFKKYGFLDSKKLTLAIGNHDIYGGVHLAEDVINFPKKCKAVNYESKVIEFEKYFRESFKGVIRGNDNMLFPCIKEFDEFILINLNSIAHYSMIKNPFASNGRISGGQLKLLEKLLSRNEYAGKQKIVITHHHFNKYSAEEETSGMIWQAIDRQTMKLRKKKSIIKTFKKLGVSTVLHGHIHEMNEYHRKDIKFINAGGSILSTNSNKLYLNCLNISKEITNEFISIDSWHKSRQTIKELSPAESAREFSFRKHFSLYKKDICLN